MTPEAAAVLASPDHEAFGMGMFHRLPQTMASAAASCPRCSAPGSVADYDSHGPEGAVGIERSFEPWNRAHLLPDVVPAMDGMADRLTAGARVADVGCGAGGAVLLLADAFPASTFTGYDISQYALARANERLGESGLPNATFSDPREAPLPTDRSLDLVTTFDCIHDMTDPQGMMHVIRDAVRDDGTWLLVDIKARDTFEENVAKNPMASLMYGISVFSCMSSALSRPVAPASGRSACQRRRPRRWLARPGSPSSASSPSTTPSTRSTKCARREHLRRFGPDRGRAGDRDPDQDASGASGSADEVGALGGRAGRRIGGTVPDDPEPVGADLRLR